MAHVQGETYASCEKAKVQVTNDFLVFATQGISSLASGAILVREGWEALNLFALPMIALACCATLWLAWRRRHSGKLAGL